MTQHPALAATSGNDTRRTRGSGPVSMSPSAEQQDAEEEEEEGGAQTEEETTQAVALTPLPPPPAAKAGERTTLRQRWAGHIKEVKR